MYRQIYVYNNTYTRYELQQNMNKNPTQIDVSDFGSIVVSVIRTQLSFAI